MRQRYTIILSSIGVVIAIAALSFFFLPWKAPLAEKLQALLETRGFQHVRLTLADIGFYSATIQNVAIGEEDPLILKNLEIFYSPLELWHGSLRELSVSGLLLEIRQKGGQWGLQGFGTQSSEKKLHLPVTENQLAALPFNHLKLHDSQINIIADSWKMATPISLEWNKTPEPDISMKSENLFLEGETFKARAEAAGMSAKINAPDQAWQGPWNLKNVQIETGNVVVPVMDFIGTIKAGEEALELTGQMQSKDALYKADFILGYSLADPQDSILTLMHATMAWHAGTLTIGKTPIPLTGTKPIKLTLQVAHVSVDEFMQSLTGKRVSATGVVSGTLPMTIGRDGSVTFGKGELRADGPGTLILPPDLIPGDDKQVLLTREILKDFHYDNLALSISSNTNNEISVLMVMGGKNPSVLEGRAVNLNIRLNGDILDLIQQSAIFLTDPQKLLHQDNP